jgi:restriction endonuclease S subunit
MLSNDDDGTFRYDAEHYQKKYKRINEILIGKKSSKLISYLKKTVVTGHTPSMKIDKFYGGDIKFIKTDNVRENKITSSFTDYLTIEGSLELESSNLKEHDILVTIIGATFDIVGRCATIQKEHLPANINQNIALIRVDTSKINSNYLSIYLNTKYGRGSLHYHSRQTEQVNLNCREVERVLVPIFPVLELKISEVCEKANSLIAESKSTYTATETLLLQTLGLANFSPSTEQVNIKSFKDSFGTSGRLDAEYYQPKYEDYQRFILRYSNGWLTISSICTLKDTNFTPKDDTEYQYIELSDIDKSGSITGCTTNNGAELPSRARRKVSKGDVLISSIEGSLQSCAIVTSKFNEALCSTGFYVLSSDKINPESLLVLFKSELMQNILKQRCSGTILTAINKNELLGIPIPIIESQIQTQIATLVQQSFTLKAQSEHLLEVAKRAVEIAIEQDEQAAMDYIKVQTGA